MKEEWWCGNCWRPIELDLHGRCSACGSDAVDRIELRAFGTNPAITRITRPIGFSSSGLSSSRASARPAPSDVERPASIVEPLLKPLE